jgi:uncharacterized protein (TIGR03437 family)
LAQAALAGGAVVGLNSTSTRLRLPSQVNVPAGSSSATFVANVQASDVDEQLTITASLQGVVRSMSMPLNGIRPTNLSCSTTAVQAGSWFDCEISLNGPNIPLVARLALSTSSPDLKIPATITTDPGQTRLGFRVFTDRCAKSQSSDIEVRFGQTAVENTVIVTSAGAPVLAFPAQVTTVLGKEAAFTFSAVDPGGLPVTIAATNLPAGASFDPATGKFSWIPGPSDAGTFEVAFTATNSAGVPSSGRVTIYVGSGKPVIAELRNAASQSSQAACSPGAVASLAGRWFTAVDSPVSDPSGAATQLGGVRVKINGDYAPMLYAARERIDFLCPNAAEGTNLKISVENDVGTDAAETTMYSLAPGLFTVDGSGTGQGLVTISGTSLVSTGRNYLTPGQPAKPGDSIAILATGLGPLYGALPVVMIGDLSVRAGSVESVPGVAGVYSIVVQVPYGIAAGGSVPVTAVTGALVGVRHTGGRTTHGDKPYNGIESNTVTIAIEP